MLSGSVRDHAAARGQALSIDNIEMFDPVPSQPIARVRASQHAAVLQLADFSRARSGASKPSIQRRVSAARHIQSEIEQRTAMLAREGGGRCPF
jgi:hypothetical protein